MTPSQQPAARLAQHAGELATETAGNVAGAAAAPRTAAMKLRALLVTPRTLTALGVLVAVFAAGRRRRTRDT
ncbi:MAG TPA: hypothetical protein VHV82_20465 [Sporichthyaceae bacterium]|nr:hypothetical protein [Sporichthyaceae bacterium]